MVVVVTILMKENDDDRDMVKGNDLLSSQLNKRQTEKGIYNGSGDLNPDFETIFNGQAEIWKSG